MSDCLTEKSSVQIWLFNHVVWPLKQLLPFWWFSTYESGGITYHAWWRMWLGKVFSHHVVEVSKVIR